MQSGLIGLIIIGHRQWDMGETAQRRRKKEKKRGETIRGWANPYTPNQHTIRADPAGEACAKSDWALKTNERSVAKQMP